MLRANLQILTSDQGLGNYTSIPLEGKLRYKVANAMGFSNTFSIVAVTVEDSSPNTIIRRGATQARIAFEMQWLADVVIQSTTGTTYVNIAPVEKKGYGKGTLNAAGGIGTAGIIKNVIDLGSTLYSWYSPSTDDPEFEFSISARESKNTRIKFKDEMKLGDLAKELTATRAFEMGMDYRQTNQALNSVGEFGGSVKGTYQGITSAFKSLFG